jgi:hypothetical protein
MSLVVLQNRIDKWNRVQGLYDYNLEREMWNRVMKLINRLNDDYVESMAAGERVGHGVGCYCWACCL